MYGKKLNKKKYVFDWKKKMYIFFKNILFFYNFDVYLIVCFCFLFLIIFC